MNLRYTLLLSVLLLGACSAPPPRAVAVEYPEEPSPMFPLASGLAEPDDMALFLAGKPVERGAILSRLQQSIDYQTHQAEMKQVWTGMASTRVRRMVEWSRQELSPLIGGGRVVLYPFGGPDLLHVSAMFPQVSTYVLMGLEPVGVVPSLESMPGGEVLAALPAFRQATRTQLRTGYFITKNMRNELDGTELRGVTPILLSTISLMGGSVNRVQPVAVGNKRGVEIYYTNSAGAVRRAIYLSGDLSNSGFDAGYRSWLEGFGGGAVYFKAASYLMHDDRFSQVREFVLGNARVVVQDDSGIPLRHFTSSNWSISYHGHYSAPIALFEKHFQADLRDAYAVNPSQPLAFGSGYHWEPHNANLIVAVRR